MDPSNAEIAERVAQYHRLRDLGVLWPDLSTREFHRAHRAIARATTAILAGDDRAHVALESDGDHRALGVAALVSRMGPLLGYWIEQGRLTAHEHAAAVLAPHLAHGRARTARLLRELERILVAFQERRIRAVVLKGADSALRYFPDPGTRPMADLDLLVGPEAIAPAREAMLALGFVERHTVNLPHRSDWVAPGVTETVQSLDVDHAANPWAVDLHYTLDRAVYPGLDIRFGPIDIEALPSWNGASLTRVLGQPLNLAYLACHTADHSALMHLHRLVELALVVRRDFAGRSGAWDAFTAFVAATRTERFVYASLELTERLVPGTLDPAAREHLARSAPPHLRRAVDATDVGSLVRFLTWGMRSRLMWAATPRDYLAYLAHLMWPRMAAGPVGAGQLLRDQAGRVRRVLSAGWRRVARAAARRH